MTTIEEAYARIERAPAEIWISRVPRADALARAGALAADLPLRGVPFAVKDNIDVAGMPTTAGCPAFAYTPARSAPVVERLEAAGAVLVGKTNLDQFATGLVGTRSPYGAVPNAIDPRYVSGGSSSGSAVAVALGLVDFALGTDTAGSGRIPAGFNGIVGLKPTRGVISTRGVVPACRTLDCVSIFARDAAFAARVFETASAYDALDPYSRADRSERGLASPVRIGVPAVLEFFGDTGYACCFDRVLARHPVTRIDFQPFLDAAALLYDGPWVAERRAAVGAFIDAHPDAVLPVTRAIIDRAREFSAADAFAAQYRLAELQRAVMPLWESIDVLLVPTAPTIHTIAAVNADPIRLNAQLGYYTNAVNLLDLAAIAVPAGARADGLPFGVTLIAPAMSDRALARLTRDFESA